MEADTATDRTPLNPDAVPRVPPEISDNILDFLAPPPSPPPSSFLHYIPDDDESQRIGTLLSCSTVCRNWAPRSRKHLYSIAWIGSADALHNLTRTLLSKPPLVPLVTEFVVAPRIWKSLDPPVRGYLPFRMFLDIKCPLRRLVLTNFLWEDTEFPPLEHAKIIRPAKRIEHLQVTSVIFPSLLMSFQFIYTFRHLSHLALIGTFFKKPPTDTDILVMAARYPNREYWAAPSLRILEIGGSAGSILPAPAVRLLGNLIEHFRLCLHIGNPIDPILLPFYDCVSNYEHLKSLQLTLQPWTSLDPPPAGSTSIDEGARVWNPIHDYLLNVFRAVRSPTLHTISVVLRWQQGYPDTMEDSAGPNPWDLPCLYRHTRCGVLDILFASDVRELLTSHPFDTLASLKVVVYDNSHEHNAARWKQDVEQRVPGLRPGLLDVKVWYRTGTAFNALWVPDLEGQDVTGDHGPSE